MQTTEINGFEIDKFNQHSLEEGKSQGICPLCSHDRNKTFQLHTFNRKGKAEKVYVKPTQPEEQSTVNDKVAEWFASRGISRSTLYEVGVTDGQEFMPQTGKVENAIQFNYFVGDQ